MSYATVFGKTPRPHSADSSLPRTIHDMLIKPWTDLPTPRHIISEAGDDEDPLALTPPVLPEVKCPPIKTTTLIVTSLATSLITDCLRSVPGVSLVGAITVSSSDPRQEEDSAEFDEEEQLYVNKLQPTEFTEPVEIPVYSNSEFAIVSIPTFKNSQVYHLVADEITSKIEFETLLGVGTSELGLNTVQLLSSQAEEDSVLAQLERLRPPHFVTGPVASVASRAKAYGKPVKVVVVNCEGAIHLNLEKCDLELLVDVGYLVDVYLGNLDPQFMNSLKNEVRVKNAASAGLYI